MFPFLESSTTKQAQVFLGFFCSGLSRDEYFVVTKLASTCHGYQSAKAELKLSLERLGMDYVDLYLIHSHKGGHNVTTWKGKIGPHM